MTIVIPLVSVLSTGLLVGNELAVALVIHPVLYSVSDEAHVRVVKPLARRLGLFMPFWYAASLVLATLQLLTTGGGALLCWAAVILLGLIIVLTILLPVPINNKIAGWNLEQLPTDWLNMRRRWDLYHRIRVVLLLGVLVLLVMSALLSHQA